MALSAHRPSPDGQQWTMEVELKFALPAPDPRLLEQLLRRSVLIGRRKPHRQHLHNTYYDTPDHALKRHGVALRVRQTGTDAHPAWVQTLKTAGVAGSGLSRRGEWEHALPGPQLDAALLRDTPWTELDPRGAWFDALQPVFTTTFERLSWVVQDADFGVEVALDRGSVLMDGHTAALCELEIELLRGTPAALFDTAAQIGQHLALLPLHMSKAERAYRLAQGTLYAPLRAQPPALNADMDFASIARTLLGESFLQFTANLNCCRSSAAPEVLHQARVGWRRFRSALKLLRLDKADAGLPSLEPLRPLLDRMAALRDLDVAATEVFALYAQAYVGDCRHRRQQWTRLQSLLAQAQEERRQALQQCLAEPATGLCLLQIMGWLETAKLPAPRGRHHAAGWLKKRVARLARQMQALPARTRDVREQHRLRILAKRLRYSVESLHSLLPPKRAERWRRGATACQTRIGMARDLLQALAIAEQLHLPEGIVEFMRGVRFSDKRLRQGP